MSTMADPVLALWRDLSKPITLWRVLRPGWHLAGIDGRALGGRLERLLKGTVARRAVPLLKDVDAETLARLAALADLNARVAEGGFRITLIANLTGPIGAVLGFSQMFPADFAKLVRFFDSEGVLPAMIGMLVLGVTTTVGWSFLRSREALELRDVLAYEQARRGLAPPR